MKEPARSPAAPLRPKPASQPQPQQKRDRWTTWTPYLIIGGLLAVIPCFLLVWTLIPKADVNEYDTPHYLLLGPYQDVAVVWCIYLVQLFLLCLMRLWAVLTPGKIWAIRALLILSIAVSIVLTSLIPYLFFIGVGFVVCAILSFIWPTRIWLRTDLFILLLHIWMLQVLFLMFLL